MFYKHDSACKRAFSLVELSIVLVILGLLTGGILAGQSLIRAAELRSVAADIARFQASITTFRDKYLALPGDMPNAVRFWGAQVGSTADGPDASCASVSTGATDMRTCNGNGNGVINSSNIVGSPAHEMHRAWQHLANAGLIEGNYAGIGRNAQFGTDNLGLLAGWNCPASKVGSDARFFIFSRSSAYDTTHEFSTVARTSHIILSSAFWDPILKPEEAWNIDTKLDDSRPGTGAIIGNPSSSTVAPNCSSSSDPATATYNLTFGSDACAVWAIIARQ